MTHFSAKFALFGWFGTKPAITPRYACIRILKFEGIEMIELILDTGQMRLKTQKVNLT